MSTPLQPATVSLILAYICPPSQLAFSPLPAHLLSQPLLMRHRFLELDPETDVKSYLMWASEEDQVFNKLEGLEPPSTRDEEPIMGIKYTADKESVFAHAELRSLTSQASADIRLVFIWDGLAWKYHNLASMPFPVDATLCVADAVSPTQNNEHSSDSDSDSDSDEYWNGYDQYDEKEHISTLQSKGDLSEEAYWESYASIQGTADSTIPTPKREPHDQETYDDALARARGLHPELETCNHSQEDIIDISYNTLNISPPRNPDPRDASSPSELSDRLSALPPRTDTSNAEILSDSDDMHGTLNNKINGKVNGVDVAVEEDLSTPQQSGMNCMDEAMKCAIRGVYNMWKPSACGKSATEDQFLHLVKEAIIG